MSMKARVRISILALVITIVTVLSALHLHGVIGEALEDVGERANILGEQVKTYLVETVSRETAAPQASRSLEESKAEWYQVIRKDPVLPRILQESLVRSQQVIEIVVLDDQNRVLAGSDPHSRGKIHARNRAFSDWQGQSLWRRIYQLFRAAEDYAITIPLAPSSMTSPVVTIRVLISSVLLRDAIMPKLRELAVISTVSLLMSVLLAVLVSNLVSGSLRTIGENIDRIADGQAAGGDDFQSPELVSVQSKLARLGRQFRGVQENASQLRSNVDQLLRSLEEAVLVFGPDGRLQMAGEHAVRLLATKRQDLAGRTMDDLFPRWTPIGSLLYEAAGSRSPIKDHEVQFDRPNMPSTSLLLNLERVDYGGGGAGMLITLRDAESRKKLRSQLDTAQRLSAISRLAAGVAHEIKNPLNAMMLHLQIATEKDRAGASTGPELEIVQKELIRLDRAVKAFLDFNRPVTLKLIDCDLAQIVADVVALTEPAARQREVQIRSGGDAAEAFISGDCDLLRQCILNVTINGIEAAPAGGELYVSVDRAANEFIVSIQDNGSGIPPEIQDKIFNLYFTTKPSGSGIGLAVAYRIVQLHGGTISFETSPAMGTCFRLKFPVSMPGEQIAAA
jgi:signal transduction histidine kinase